MPPLVTAVFFLVSSILPHSLYGIVLSAPLASAAVTTSAKEPAPAASSSSLLTFETEISPQIRKWCKHNIDTPAPRVLIMNAIPKTASSAVHTILLRDNPRKKPRFNGPSSFFYDSFHIDFSKQSNVKAVGK
jgi:hypothetical protein